MRKVRIEIIAAGKKKKSVSEFVADYTKLGNMTDRVVETFKTVESKLHNLNGGVGTLQPALDCIENRIQKTDRPRVQKAERVGQRFAMFVVNSINTDRRVAEAIRVSNSDFYDMNPWAVPPPPPRKKKWYEKLWDGIKSGFKAIGKAFKDAFNWVGDKIKKAWHATVDFLKKHYKTIIKIAVGAVIIGGLFALSVVTGGAAAPILGLAAKAALTTALTSTATSVVSGIIQGKSAGEIFDSAGDSFFKGAVTGAISGAVGGVGPAVLEATGSAVLSKGAQILAEGAGQFLGGMITEGADYLEKNGTLSGFFSDYASRAGMEVLGSMASSALGEVGGFLKDKAGGLLNSAMDSLSNTSFGKTVSDVFNTVKQNTSWLTGDDGLLSKLGINGLGDLGINSLEDVKNIFNDPSKFAQNLGSNVLDKVLGSSGVKDMLSTGLSQLSDSLGLSKLFDSGLSGVMDKLGIGDINLSNIADKLGVGNIDLGNIADKLGIGSLSEVADKLGIGNVNISDIADKLGVGGIADIADKLGVGSITDIANKVGDVVDHLPDSVSSVLPNFAKDLGLGGLSVSDIADSLGVDGISDIAGKLGVDNIADAVSQIGSGSLTDIADKLGIGNVNISDIADKLGVGGLTDIADRLGFSEVSEIADKLGNVVDQLPDSVKTTLPDFSKDLGFGNLSVSDIADQIGSGSLSGIAHKLDADFSALGSFVTGGADGLAKAAGKLPGDLLSRVGENANQMLMHAHDAVIDSSKNAVDRLCRSGFAQAINSSISKVNNAKDKAMAFLNSDHKVTIGFGKSGLSFGFT